MKTLFDAIRVQYLRYKRDEREQHRQWCMKNVFVALQSANADLEEVERIDGLIRDLETRCAAARTTV